MMQQEQATGVHQQTGVKEIMGLSELNANPDPDSLTGVTGVYQNRPLFLVNILYISCLNVYAL